MERHDLFWKLLPLLSYKSGTKVTLHQTNQSQRRSQQTQKITYEDFRPHNSQSLALKNPP